MPTLDEVKARVRDDVVKQKAVETARQKAAALAAQLKTGDFTAAAKAAGLEVKTTELIARGAPIARRRRQPGDRRRGVRAAGRRRERSDRHRQRRGDREGARAAGRRPTDGAREGPRHASARELLNERRNQFFSAYMTKARERMKININQATIAQLLA